MGLGTNRVAVMVRVTSSPLVRPAALALEY